MSVYKSEFVGCHLHQQKFDRLRKIREKVNWDIEEERQDNFFLGQLYLLLSDWKCQYQAEEINWLLTESITFRDEEDYNRSGELIIKFVANSGYKYQPKIEQDGKPRVHRTTALHHVARSGFLNNDIMVRELFKIYNNFNINYTDSSGLTNFHVACAFGCDDVVEKFLELGQDPNLLVHEIGYSALHLALAYDRRNVARLLLKSGANPNLANPEGSTALHLICKMDRPKALMKSFLKICLEKRQPLLLDAQDKEGKTALHLALENGRTNIAKWLLRKGADPTLANPEGSTALHLICKMNHPKALMNLILKKCLGKRQPLPLDAQNKEGKTALHLALEKGHREVVQLLLERGADPNLAHPEGLTALQLICKMDSSYALMRLLFEISDKKNQPLPLDAQDKEGKTALHLALGKFHGNIADWLLIKGANPNLADNKGSTALHIICKMIGFNYLAHRLFEISDEKHREVLVDAQDNEGNTPLHFAILNHDEYIMARLLLGRGANPTLANKDGQIPLHIARFWYNDVELLGIFFELTNAKYHSGQLNAKDILGRTPLHRALKLNKVIVSEYLLRLGADPHLTDGLGNTALHVMSKDSHNEDLVEMFFKVNEELNQHLQIDATDTLGRTPLSLALECGNKKMIEQLMRRGADLKLAIENDEWTPLHFVCSRPSGNDVAGLFLKIMNEDRRETVLIDTRDGFGRTPLQYAVASLSPNTIDVLLDHGADLSNFVFPSERRFDQGVQANGRINIKVTSGILAVVERLETRGYELSRSDALMIMNLFAKHKLFVKSADLEVLNWQDHEEVTREAKETMISPSLSLYDLLHLRPKDVAKRITFKEFFEFARDSEKLWMLRKKGFEARVVAHLCEKLSRRFFQSYALYPFWDLIHKRLPFECCDFILDNVMNEVLYNIFLIAGE
ncbi:ankyrin-3-like [Trichogramma pretiosum]|uniref:ankyrin-3-like n=1 Tax=Trichogramma pretiosum TaxID=7493 RepID=UPI0006C972BD|nr:ankyrin-3-like [Trichogramma pretiosum]